MARKDKNIRKCIACNTYKDKKYLIRIMINHLNGDILINPSSKYFGRSAYICSDNDCIDNAFKKMKISKILNKKVDPNILEKIKTVLEK